MGLLGRLWDRIEGQRQRTSSSPFSGKIDNNGGPAADSGEVAVATEPVLPAFATPTDIKRRTVLSAPRLVDVAPVVTPRDDDTILIKAEVGRSDDECRFLTNRTILAGFSWWYPEASTAVDSPLVAALFELEGITSVLVDDSTLTITRGSSGDWRPLAEAVGTTVRTHLMSEDSPIGASVVEALPAPGDVEACAQEVIDTVINPGVAAHSGHIRLVAVRGNSVTIEMGGGCQGCSAADVTLKQGIHGAFRDAMPSIGGIYDDTDHAAGLNPFFR